MQEPNIEVGILFDSHLKFCLSGNYRIASTNLEVNGAYELWEKDGKIELKGENLSLLLDELCFVPKDYSSSVFELQDVTIGIDFHWERKENLRYRGSLKIVVEDGKLWAINILPVEDYLKSVISSEMRATSSLELLKAHSIISRSWLLAQIEKDQKLKEESTTYISFAENNKERIRWYDREDHLLFDVCADDHCQRYQGITRTTTALAEKAVEETRGMVLFYQGKICDARYSKSCGGVSELFENVWEEEKHPYLQKVVDVIPNPFDYGIKLDQEENAEEWIRTSPKTFCNCQDKEVLAQVLNDYDQETNDFYRWRVVYSQKELSDLIRKRSGIDFGEIVNLIPLERGVSGRLIRLKIVGTKRVMNVGKELEIRKWLSNSHLYSSAFVVDTYNEEDGIPQRFELTGAGWGHGVGLCQIGAAVMGAKGYNYNEILLHYFRGADLRPVY
ncbi:MAG: SpoIID/LytB domain-containing protein [Marinifilaceae bacterium]